MFKHWFTALGLVGMLYSPAQGATELNFISLHPDRHPATIHVLVPWIEKIKTLSQGELIIYKYNINDLCPDRETYDATVTGLTDIGSNVSSSNPERFALHEVLELPLLSRGSRAATLAVQDLAAKYPEWRAEHADTHMLLEWTTPAFQLHTMKKPVRTLEDLKGMKILVWNATLLETMKLLGANPILVTPTDSYLSLSRGMGDGVVAPTAVVRAFKLDEVTKFHTVCDLSAGVFWGAMNKDRWNSLSDEQKKILETTTGPELAKAMSVAIDVEGTNKDFASMAAQGHEIIELSMEERARWQDKTQPMYDAWLKRLAAKGSTVAPQVLSDMRDLMEKYYQQMVASGSL